MFAQSLMMKRRKIELLGITNISRRRDRHSFSTLTSYNGLPCTDGSLFRSLAKPFSFSA
jgi:hypothetical protein